MTYSIIADGLVKRFGDTRALNGIDLAVRTGTVFGLLGPNGAGKTTAVRILATLARPDGGHAIVCGHDVVRHAHQVRQLTGLTGQYASVDETLTGQENLVLIARCVWCRGIATRLPPVSRPNRSSSRAATCSGAMVRRRAAASSMASGMPSSARQILATAAAFAAVISNPGTTARARWDNSRTEAELSALPIPLTAGSGGSVSGPTVHGASPVMLSGSRLVARMRICGQAARIRSASVAAAAPPTSRTSPEPARTSSEPSIATCTRSILPGPG